MRYDVRCCRQDAGDRATKPSLKQIGKLVGKGTPKKAGSVGAGGLLGLHDVTRQIMITRSINKVLNTADNEGRTPLHLAALMNRFTELIWRAYFKCQFLPRELC